LARLLERAVAQFSLSAILPDGRIPSSYPRRPPVASKIAAAPPIPAALRISDFARKSCKKQGIKIHTGATVSSLERSGENVVARIEGGGQGSELAVERVILVVGIVGNVEEIGIEGTGVAVER
jgi:Pyridine nucleotide-disulphide oxidoreductase